MAHLDSRIYLLCRPNTITRKMSWTGMRTSNERKKRIANTNNLVGFQHDVCRSKQYLKTHFILGFYDNYLAKHVIRNMDMINLNMHILNERDGEGEGEGEEKEKDDYFFVEENMRLEINKLDPSFDKPKPLLYLFTGESIDLILENNLGVALASSVVDENTQKLCLNTDLIYPSYQSQDPVFLRKHLSSLYQK